jgi:hypothetical protein
MLIDAAHRAITQAKSDGDTTTVTSLCGLYERAAVYLRRYAAYQEARGALADARGEFALARDLYHGDDIGKARALAKQGVTIIPVEAFDALWESDDLLEGASLFQALADACR